MSKAPQASAARRAGRHAGHNELRLIVPEPEKVQPHDLEAERATLGAVLVDPTTFDSAAAIVSSSDYFRKAHRLVFDAMGECVRRNVPIDFLTVCQVLAERGDLEEVGGPAYVSSLSDGVPRSANIETYARTVVDKAKLRRLIQAGNDLVMRAYGAGAQADAILSEHRVRLDGHVVSQVGLLTDVDVIQRPEPNWLVEGRVPLDSIGALVAEPAMGKTFAALELAFACATGQTWLGATVPPASIGPAVLVTPEGLSGIGRRMAATKRARGLPLYEAAGVHLWPHMVDLLSPRSVMTLVGAIRPLGARLVVIDTLARNFTGDENSTADMSCVINSLTEIRQSLNQGVVLVVHHMSASGRRERGNTALRGGCDFMLFMTLVDGVMTLSCAKQKDAAHFAAVGLTLGPTTPGGLGCVLQVSDDEPDGGQTPADYTPEASTSDLSNPQRRILEVLETSFATAGATTAEWETAVSQTTPRATYFRARAELIRKGLVVQNGARFYVRRPHGSLTAK